MENIKQIAPKKSSIKGKSGGNTYYVKSIFVVILFLVMIVIEVGNGRSYHDEVIGIISAVYLLFMRKKIERRDMITLVTLAVVVAIGIVSNLVSNLTSSIFSICVDIIAETKLIFGFFAIKYFLSDKEKQATINMLLPLSKLYTLAAFSCSIISLFTDIGMSGEERYGIPSFKFIFFHNHQYVAVYMLFFGVLVCNKKMSDTERKIYYALAIVSLMLATKAPPIIFSVIFIGLAFYFKKHDVISPGVMILGIILIVTLGWYQIENYLLRDDVPRHIFFEYSFKTANNYFPLGSGFSTFGSDQAARNYSKLYYQYGFDKMYGMTPEEGMFLSDNFWAMAIGQFGWIGSLVYISVFVRIFLTFSSNKYSNQHKAFLYAAYIQYMIHAVGSAILSSSAGLIGFMAIAMFTFLDDDTKKRTPKFKIYF
ncbi:MAG: hypothetical protein PUE08_02125 [Eubacteriales bacterium]|nr:hypothetical protein [Eubacteriales bacterium]